MEFRQHFEDIKTDMWEYLEKCNKPIALYGMGDGADKIAAELEKRGLEISAVFASDGFVREKTAYGCKVETFSSVKEKFSDPVVLVCFGTKRSEVLENIERISHQAELFAPDVPVFGDKIFDLKYFSKNFSRLETVYSKLADDISKKAFINSIKFRLTGKTSYLPECQTDIQESYKTILKPFSGCTYVDVGAYNGDTIREFSSFSGQDITVHAFEPDSKNFKKLELYASNCNIKKINLYNYAAWDKNEELTFFARSGRNSANTTSHANAKAIVLNACTVDSRVSFADFMKIDAEGADLQVLAGAKELIKAHTPTLCVAAYHRTEDYFVLPEKICEITSEYDIYFRHFIHIPCWDTNFYFRKKAQK